MDCSYADGQKMLITKKKKCEKAWLEKNSLVLLHIRIGLFCLFCPPDECRSNVTKKKRSSSSQMQIMILINVQKLRANSNNEL